MISYVDHVAPPSYNSKCLCVCPSFLFLKCVCHCQALTLGQTSPPTTTTCQSFHFVFLSLCSYLNYDITQMYGNQFDFLGAATSIPDLCKDETLQVSGSSAPVEYISDQSVIYYWVNASQMRCKMHSRMRFHLSLCFYFNSKKMEDLKFWDFNLGMKKNNYVAVCKSSIDYVL